MTIKTRKYNHLGNSQANVFRFIIAYKTENDGRLPTVREIANDCNLSISTISHHLNELQKAKKITRDPLKSRSIQVVGGGWQYQPQGGVSEAI